jgi:hypothetical protein
MKITGWSPGSQSVKLILLFTEISLAYVKNPVTTAQTEKDFYLFETHLPRRASI